jgi:hypothetical protein
LKLIGCKIMDVEAVALEVGTIWVGGRAHGSGAGLGPWPWGWRGAWSVMHLGSDPFAISVVLYFPCGRLRDHADGKLSPGLPGCGGDVLGR